MKAFRDFLEHDLPTVSMTEEQIVQIETIVSRAASDVVHSDMADIFNDATAPAILAYQIYLMTQDGQNPVEMLGLTPGTVLHLVHLTKRDSYFMDAFQRILDESPYFRELCRYMPVTRDKKHVSIGQLNVSVHAPKAQHLRGKTHAWISCDISADLYEDGLIQATDAALATVRDKTVNANSQYKGFLLQYI